MDEKVIAQVKAQFQLMGNLDPIMDEVLHECLPAYFDCELWISALGWVTIQIPWQVMGLFRGDHILRDDLPELSFTSPKGTHIQVYDVDQVFPGKVPKKIKKYEVSFAVSVKNVYINATLSPGYSGFDIERRPTPSRSIALYSEECTDTSTLKGEYNGDLYLHMRGRTLYQGKILDYIAIHYSFTDRTELTLEESIEVINQTYLKTLVDTFF